MNWNLAHAFVYGEVDWDQLEARLRGVCPFLSGAIFGAGWWCLIDALVYSKVVLNESYPFSYNLPGIVATVALIMMNLVSRDDLANMADAYSSDEGSEGRAKLWLFLSYCIAFGAVAGSVAVLVTCVQHHEHVQVGVGALLQCGLILLSGLLLWAFRSDDGGYAAIH
ncbi:g1202 [Coccomyxa viridis]|uniref:G1202 protein n=1 Tax=Coccomyxa viridis TaxID=1274662 RepID=A0ABP1FHG6_9CHLO